MKLMFENWKRFLKEEVIDLSKYRAEKERESRKDIVLITKAPSYSGEHTVYDPREFELVIVSTEEQFNALQEGDFQRAEDLGAQFDTVIDEEKWGY